MIHLALMVVSAILWRLGGKYDKFWRRLVLPSLLACFCVLMADFRWVYPIMGVCYGLVFRLPFTLKGSDLSDSWLNWAWVSVWACLLVAPGLLYNCDLWPAILSAGLIAVCAYLSNIKATRLIFTWDRCEYIFGAAVSILLAAK